MMKIKQIALVKTVSYYGFLLQIPEDHNHVATDRNGDIYSYISAPVLWADTWFSKTEQGTLVGCADLESANKNWRSSHQSFEAAKRQGGEI